MSKYKKEQIIKKIEFSLFTLLLAGVFLFIFDYPNVRMRLFGPVEFESLKPDEIKTGLVVEASINMNFGAYACEGEKSYYEIYLNSDISKVKDVYYVIWTGDLYADDYKYMGIKVPASEQSAMEEMVEAMNDGNFVEPVKYTGIITQMTSKEYPFFEAYFQEAGWTEEEIEERTLPYTINTSYMEEQDSSGYYILIAIFLTPAIIAIWCMKWK